MESRPILLIIENTKRESSWLKVNEPRCSIHEEVPEMRTVGKTGMADPETHFIRGPFKWNLHLILRW